MTIRAYREAGQGRGDPARCHEILAGGCEGAAEEEDEWGEDYKG